MRSLPDSTTHGDGLVICMREIPALFFSEKFELSEPETYAAATDCEISEFEEVADFTAAMAEQMSSWKKRVETLSNHLDLIEVHLLREISARSDSFFEALSVLQVSRQNIFG